VSPPVRCELRVGFMALLDCALLVVAHEVGMARQQGIALKLVRESSWANIRDRVAVGHFDAAHMLGPMVLAENMGLGHFDAPLVAPAALGTGGNAITVSAPLWAAMQRQGAAIGAAPAVQARALAAVVGQRVAADSPPLTLAMVFPYSCHHLQLRDWLASGGIDAERDVRLVVLPPPLLVDALRSGQVDAFCVGEPWNSLAVDSGLGVLAVACSDLWPRPPEKVLGMRERFAAEHPAEVAALVRALHGAARWAADAGNHADLAQLLAQPRYVGAPARLLQAVLGGSVCAQSGLEPLSRPEFVSFGPEATWPRTAHAEMLVSKMEACGQVARSAQARQRAVESFRGDLYAAAIGQPAAQ
jgi:NitT/TauT family transport system ATP-binding protein